MRKMILNIVTAIAFAMSALTLAATSSAVASPNHKLMNQPAPNWIVSEWINGNPGNLQEHRGKVVVIDFFQLWCPGCKAFTLPLMQEWQTETFASEYANDQIEFISIHTVFEGRDYQTPERLRDFIRQWNITRPVGNDQHVGGEGLPITMQFYGTRGTPEIAIVGKNGKVRFQESGYFDPNFGATTVRALLNE